MNTKTKWYFREEIMEPLIILGTLVIAIAVIVVPFVFFSWKIVLAAEVIIYVIGIFVTWIARDKTAVIVPDKKKSLFFAFLLWPWWWLIRSVFSIWEDAKAHRIV